MKLKAMSIMQAKDTINTLLETIVIDNVFPAAVARFKFWKKWLSFRP